MHLEGMEHQEPTNRWAANQLLGMVSLFQGDVEAAEACALSLRSDAAVSNHPGMASVAQSFDMVTCVAAGQFERFQSLTSQRPTYYGDRWDKICALGRVLLACARAREFEDVEVPAPDALVEMLRSDVAILDEWHELLWHLALRVYPRQLITHRLSPTIVAGEGAAWFVAGDGSLTDLSGRPSLHRLFRALLERHASPEPTPIDTFALFDIGWPDVQIDPTAARNRVYVGVSNLRKLGLRSWLLQGPDGYMLSPELFVVTGTQTNLDELR